MFPGKIFLSSEEQTENTDSFKKIPANIVPSANFLKQLSKEPTTFPSIEDCKILEHPWQIFEYNDWAIRQDFEMLTAGRISGKFLQPIKLFVPKIFLLKQAPQLITQF